MKRAGCDIGCTIERHNGKDLCIMNTLAGRLEGDFTIPEDANYTGLIGNPETTRLELERTGSGNTDYWVSEQKSFRFPAAL